MSSTPPTRRRAETESLLAWYAANRRILPWRALPGTRSAPYAVWLSEIMLQQTTVEAVKPYFARFMARWPDVRALAAAEEGEVLAAWAGLGYYARARNLIRCAKTVVAEHGGEFPATETALRTLPGIGAYTAAAIAAIAFGQRAIVIDGNVERVITRLFAIATPLPKARSEIANRLEGLTPDEEAGDFAQALMDLASAICRPKAPGCLACPLANGCATGPSGRAVGFPVKPAKKGKPLRYGVIFAIRTPSGALALRTRAETGLLGGMSELPGTSWREGQVWQEREITPPLPLNWRVLPGEVRHVFTHFDLRLTIWQAEAREGIALPEGWRLVARAALAKEALPTVMRKVIEKLEA